MVVRRVNFWQFTSAGGRGCARTRHVSGIGRRQEGCGSVRRRRRRRTRLSLLLRPLGRTWGKGFWLVFNHFCECDWAHVPFPSDGWRPGSAVFRGYCCGPVEVVVAAAAVAATDEIPAPALPHIKACSVDDLSESSEKPS